MDFNSPARLREIDRQAIAAGPVAGERLMARAGAAVARAVWRLLCLGGGRQVLLIAGGGNNGGDAFVAARRLRQWGATVELCLTCAPAALRGEAAAAWRAWGPDTPPWRLLSEAASWDDWEPGATLAPATVIVDGLLGTGTQGAPRGVAAAAIRWFGRLPRDCRVVAIDLPSGLDAVTGDAAAALRADLTVTLGFPKCGFAEPAAWAALGRVEVATLDLADPEPAAAPPCTFIAGPELAAILPPRRRDAHKGDFGRLLLIGGARAYPGAPALMALGAARAGAGLITAAVPPESLAALAAQVPEAMAQALAAPAGCLTLDALRRWRADLSAFDAMVAGPGMTAGAETRAMVDWLLAGGAPRLLLDADALNVLAGWAAETRAAGLPPPAKAGRLILTPHPGEAARLLGCDVAEVQADRVSAVRRLAARTGAVVVLKGAGTLVGAPGGTPALNLTGNPGMAGGGAGDVLAGIIAALWAQGLSAEQAARLGVWLHGSAGDFAIWRSGARSVTAHLLAERLDDAFAALS